MAFSVDDHAARVDRLRTDDLDFEAFRTDPLDEDTLRCLRYMHDVESHTICYLRDLLLTKAHRDPEITTFLGFWAFEEHWHGEAIGRVLEAHDEPGGRARVAAHRGSLGWKDRVSPLATMAASSMVRDFAAVQMTWGAINEWSTQAGYAQLARRAEHPLLSELLRRIMKQEGLHIDFYVTQARQRLEASASTRRITRFALRHLWTPVGAGVMPRSEVSFLVDHLFGDADGRAAAGRIDRCVDRLPGLAGLELLSGALARYGSPASVAIGGERAGQAPELTRSST